MIDIDYEAARPWSEYVAEERAAVIVHQDFAAVKTAMHTPLVFDGRNLFNPDTMREFGFDYRAVGRAGAK
jgi:UDPglucose 6-dehydrogenase